MEVPGLRMEEVLVKPDTDGSVRFMVVNESSELFKLLADQVIGHGCPVVDYGDSDGLRQNARGEVMCVDGVNEVAGDGWCVWTINGVKASREAARMQKLEGVV